MALDAQYHAPGSMAAAFLPAIGPAPQEPVRVIRSQSDEEVAFGDADAVARSGTILVRMSEVADPAAGDVFGLETGQQLRIVGAPRTDVEGLEWTCAVEAVA